MRSRQGAWLVSIARSVISDWDSVTKVLFKSSLLRSSTYTTSACIQQSLRLDVPAYPIIKLGAGGDDCLANLAILKVYV